MDDYRSKSYGHGRMELDSYYGTGSNGAGGGPNSSAINGMQDLRCYSASYACPPKMHNNDDSNTNNKFKKGKSANGSVSKSWSFSDPELQRKKRVASYKVYTVEGKLKGTLRKSFRWLKETCDRVVYGR
ncbi:hypothetical protein RchiOBHm_Chr2g0093771 [Rosa chinensis]|uniref:DUF3511 domain-containing protein n=1 Tax=Rosa chinensis TaxID=74649 RepID=A0A2P6RKF6_ROSCH|nr:uncharacterized protein LOC112187923 [Rosa chinensis]PRQ46881.1 hypothetical protein RchiOBHm_Chr2g0093771 [Rosa chinensis]